MRALLVVGLLAVVALVGGLLVNLRAPPAAKAPVASDVRARPVASGAVEGEDWPYEAVSPEEQVVIDRGREVEGWDEVHRGFSEAAHQGVEAR